MVLNYVYNSTISNNIFSDSPYGIEIDGSDNIFYNNLFNNSVNIYLDEPLENFWNVTRQSGTRIYSTGTEIGGNYWTNSTGNSYSDTCIDTDKDGFCDEPLEIASYDYLPLSDEYPIPTSTLTPLNDTLSDVGQGVGNLLLNISPPLAIFVIILSVTAMFGFIFSSFGKKTGEGI
jgi:parallel beta-helix repeat protein